MESRFQDESLKQQQQHDADVKKVRPAQLQLRQQFDDDDDDDDDERICFNVA